MEVRFVGRRQYIPLIVFGAVLRLRPHARYDVDAGSRVAIGALSMEEADAATPAGSHRSMAGDFLRPHDLGIPYARARTAADVSRQPVRVGVPTVCRTADSVGAVENSHSLLAHGICGKARKRNSARSYCASNLQRAR